VSAGRWELLRALGAVAGAPADALAVLSALGLAGCDDAAHTSVFVLNCPPYASVYLGGEGGLGGEAADRVAGFWRAIEMEPPAPADHLTGLLSLYAQLGEAGPSLAHARSALFFEHLWSWLPGYLDAVGELGVPALTAWAGVLTEALGAERDCYEAGSLPVALRGAPPPAGGDCGVGELLDTLIAPVRSGMILTRRAVASGAGQAGAGHRIGERRFALRAMLEQEPAGTCAWLAGEASRWSARHVTRWPDDPVRQWWAARAARTAAVLRSAL
jgi:nitrate reductase delta subunit